jgi:alpha-L-fucosidase
MAGLDLCIPSECERLGRAKRRDCAEVSPGLDLLLLLDWSALRASYLAEFVAYYYNESSKRGPVGIINSKLVDMQTSAVLDIERVQLSSILPETWQTDTSVSNKSWGYIENDTFKTPEFIVQQLADVVSKIGNQLLNIGPVPTGPYRNQSSRCCWMLAHG